MIKVYLFLFSILIYIDAKSQYCTNVGPSSTIDSNVGSVQLIGETGSINYIGCPGVIGLQDLTFLSTTLNAGSSYLAQIQFSTCGGNYSGAGQAWIDFNINGVYEASESIGTWQGIPPTAISNFNFTVPAGAISGLTRMRVTQQEGGFLPLNPCATFAWGSVMDFGITIASGIDCSGYIGDDMTDPIIVPSIPYSSTGDNSYCYSNQNLVYSSPDVYYQLNPTPLMQSITVTLCGSSFDTFLSIVDPLGNIIAYNDDDLNCNTQSTLTFSTIGITQAYIIVEGWGSASGTYDIAINANYLGTDEIEEDLTFIYPNPTEDYFQINNVNGAIDVIDITGKIVISIDEYDQQKISVQELEKGVYTVLFKKNDLTYSKKLLVQ